MEQLRELMLTPADVQVPSLSEKVTEDIESGICTHREASVRNTQQTPK
jgi:hypothetical protein